MSPLGQCRDDSGALLYIEFKKQHSGTMGRPAVAMVSRAGSEDAVLYNECITTEALTLHSLCHLLCPDHLKRAQVPFRHLHLSHLPVTGGLLGLTGPICCVSCHSHASTAVTSASARLLIFLPALPSR